MTAHKNKELKRLEQLKQAQAMERRARMLASQHMSTKPHGMGKPRIKKLDEDFNEYT